MKIIEGVKIVMRNGKPEFHIPSTMNGKAFQAWQRDNKTAIAAAVADMGSTAVADMGSTAAADMGSTAAADMGSTAAAEPVNAAVPVTATVNRSFVLGSVTVTVTDGKLSYLLPDSMTGKGFKAWQRRNAAKLVGIV